MKNILILFGIFLLLISCKNKKSIDKNYESESLKIIQLTENTFLHISYLQTNDYGKVPCNGLVFYDNNEAIIIETPTNNRASVELIKWVENELKSKIKGVICNHFHVDCLGGLKEFHKQNIKSYANAHTIELAKQQHFETPKNDFKDSLSIKAGAKIITNTFFGEAHTKDNIVTYIPSEKVLFGGCAIKSLNATKGNLNDANVSEWATTVKKVKREYSEKTKYVVPGHGNIGGVELLDYTINLFKLDN